MSKIVIPQTLHVTEGAFGASFQRGGRGGSSDKRQQQSQVASRELYLLLNQISRKLNDADAQAAVATADASDLATAITLTNALKVAVNALIAALQK